jgi:Ion channel
VGTRARNTSTTVVVGNEEQHVPNDAPRRLAALEPGPLIGVVPRGRHAVRDMSVNAPIVGTRRLRKMVKILIQIGGLAILALVVYFLIPLDRQYAEIAAGALVIGATFALVPLAVHRARRVLTSDQPVLVAAQSLAITLMLLIVSFSSVYFVLGSTHEGQINGIRTKIDALYFTITILSTVGFGDVTATGQAARALVTTQMVVDLVFLAVAIRLFTWALEQRKDDTPNRPTRVPRSTPGPEESE